MGVGRVVDGRTAATAARLLWSLVLAAAVTAVATPRGQSAAPRIFDDRELQRISLQVNSRDWDTLRANFRQNTYYPASFTWKGQTLSGVGIRSRGSGTRSGQKPGLLVDFDRYANGQRFQGLEALVLDNHLQDPSAMREALTMALYDRMGIQAPREAAVELYINGEFFGLYNAVESIDEIAVSRMYPVPASSAPAPPVRVPPAAWSLPTPESVGYLYDFNWVDYFYGTYPGVELDLYEEMFEPETREDETREALFRQIELLFRAVNEVPADRFLQEVGARLDLARYLRIAAVQAYMASFDGIAGAFGMNNFYLYRPVGSTQHTIIPWDEDNAFHSLEHRIDSDHDKHVLIGRALRLPDLRALYFQALDEIIAIVDARETAQGPGWLEREILRRQALIAARVREDRVKPYTEADFVSAVAFNVDFARRRTAIVRAQMAEMGR
jgi:Ni/Co efflux regulator RcnB